MDLRFDSARRFVKLASFAGAALAVALTPVRDADACGGWFVLGTDTVSSVGGHRMAFSISPAATTLWDQIAYTGDPASFAWVLPIKGQVEIGLSSDALFAELDMLTAVTVSSPDPPPCPGFGGAGVGGGFDGSSGVGGGEVVVIADAVVGPYETVQLSSQDPQALAGWLSQNGYVIPPDVQPVIDAYVAEGFDFLALKLVPGQGIDKIKPVRVTTPGAGLTLPLRMVAAGTGTIVPLTLWVLGEGRYEPQNFPVFMIDGSDLVWDWTRGGSNYVALVQQGFKSTNGLGWLVQAGQGFSKFGVQGDLVALADSDPLGSGYGDDAGSGAHDACVADLDALFGAITAPWITRLEAQLPHGALANDLALQASADQTPIKRDFVAKGVNSPCPTTGSGASGASDSGAGAASGAGASNAASGGAGGAGSNADGGSSGGCGCSVAGSQRPLDIALAAVALGALARRRRRVGGSASGLRT